MKVLINNVEVLCDKNIIIEEEMLNTSSVILNNVFPKSWENDKDYVSRFYYPPDYSKCLIYDDNNVLIFCGIVKNTGNISLNPREPHYCNLQVLDFKDFLSQILLDFVIVNKTISEAITQVVNYVSDYGFVVGNIELLNGNEEIGAYSTEDKSPYDVFQYIADITQSRWTTRMIDQNSVAIDFYDPSLMPEGTEIEYTNEWFKDNEIIDMNFSYGTYDYRNKQIMSSDEVFANIRTNETLVANGYQVQYDTEQKIGEIISIKVDGVEKTFITNQYKDLGQIADFYYTPGEAHFTSDNALSTGQVILIEYISIIQGRQIVIDQNEIAKISNLTNRNGTISRYEKRNDATTSNELQNIGKSYIQYKGVPEIILNVEATTNIWNIGERVSLSSAPLDELETEYMVRKKTTKYIASIKTIFYSYELVSSFNSEDKINYFDNQRAKNKGNIGEGEFIARNVDYEANANIIFYNREFNKVVPDGDNKLNCILNSPFTE